MKHTIYFDLLWLSLLTYSVLSRPWRISYWGTVHRRWYSTGFRHSIRIIRLNLLLDRQNMTDRRSNYWVNQLLVYLASSLSKVKGIRYWPAMFLVKSLSVFQWSAETSSVGGSVYPTYIVLFMWTNQSFFVSELAQVAQNSGGYPKVEPLEKVIRFNSIMNDSDESWFRFLMIETAQYEVKLSLSVRTDGRCDWNL